MAGNKWGYKVYEGEANQWIIDSPRNWLMVVKFNGELTDSEQQDVLKYITRLINDRKK